MCADSYHQVCDPPVVAEDVAIATDIQPAGWNDSVDDLTILPEDFVDLSGPDESTTNTDVLLREQRGDTECVKELLEEDAGQSAAIGECSVATDIHDIGSVIALPEEATDEPATAKVAPETTASIARDKDAEVSMTSPDTSMEATARTQRVYLRGTTVEISIGDEDLAILETFSWDGKSKQWVGPTKMKDLNEHLARSLEISRGLSSGVRGYPYQTVAVTVCRVGKKYSTKLTHSGDGWWRASHGGRTKLKLWNLKRILRGKAVALKCVSQ